MIALALAFLLAQPGEPQHKVAIVAREPVRPGVFSRLSRGLSALAHRLYEKEDQEVAQGNALLMEGDPERALQSYDKAKERLPEDSKESSALAFNRSSALLKQGAEKAAEATSEAAHALAHGEPSLKAKAAYQLALGLESAGKTDDAMKAYAAALALDPDDTDAKVNLELLLKSKEERKQQQQTGQQKDEQQKEKHAGKKDPDQEKAKGKQDEQQKAPEKEEEKQAGDKKEKQEPQAGKEPEQKPDKPDDAEKQAEQQGKKAEEKKPEEKPGQASAQEKPVDRSEAERLLDALRSSEKNLQAWRFAKDKRKDARRGELEKDW